MATKSLKKQKQEVIDKIEKLGFFKELCVGCKLEKSIKEMQQIGKKNKYICKNCLKKLEAGDLYKPQVTISDNPNDYSYIDKSIIGDSFSSSSIYTGTSVSKINTNKITESEYKQLLSFANGS